MFGLDMIPQEKQTEHLLSKLRAVFADGYRPARGLEPYATKLKNGSYAYSMVNCLGHVFNLRNRQFNDYKIKPYQMFGAFSGMRYETKEMSSNHMIDFIKETGLKVEACDPKKPIEDFKSWKVALYFNTDLGHPDFHYLLEERPRIWSSKVGFAPCVEHVYMQTPPSYYRNMVDEEAPQYEFYGSYKITNPNAKANNRYLRNFRFNTKGLKIPEKEHCVVEYSHDFSIDKFLEELLAGL